MRGGSLPPAMLCAALALALAFAPRKAIALGLLALAIGAAASAFVPIAESWREPLFLACWVWIVVTAAFVHLAGGIGVRFAPALALVSGILCGAIVTVAGAPGDLLKGLPWALLVVPGAWLVETRRGIALKVASSWLIAVAVLAAALPITPTPGYEPDHLE